MTGFVRQSDPAEAIFVAGRACGPGDNPERVLVAIDSHVDDAQDIAGRLPLLPKRAPAAGPEMRLSGITGKRQRLRVHMREHQHLPRIGIGDDGSDEAVHVISGIKDEARFAFV